MKRVISILCIFMLSLTCIFAQENQNPEDLSVTEPNTIEFKYVPYQAGDQYLRISVAVSFPLGFGDLFSGNQKMNIGGAGTLGYHYFVLDYLALGAEVSFGFNTTIGSHTYNYVPILFTVTTVPTVNKFEFPITLGIGFATENYNNYKYFPGLALKAEGGIYYRFSSSWSAGFEATYRFLPQFAGLYSSSAHNIMGNFLNLTLGAKYHF